MVATEQPKPWLSLPGVRSVPSIKPQPWWLVVVIAAGVGIPAVTAALSGSLAIPHNDSWAYSRIASVFWRTGQIHLLNYNDMTLIGQLFIVGPLGTSTLAQQVGVVLLGAAVLWCCYALAKARTTTGRALLVAATVPLWPGFASLTTSFMTDIPALAASVLTVLVGRRALAADSRQAMALTLVIAFWGATVREVTLAAPAAVLLVGLVNHHKLSRLNPRFLVATAAVFALPLLVFLYWRASLPNGQDPPLSIHLSTVPGQTLDVTEGYFFMTSAILAPFSLLVTRPWRWRWPSWIAALLVVGLAVRTELLHYGFFLGDYFDPTGEYYYVLEGVRNVIPPGLWNLVTPLAIVGGVALAGELVAHWRKAEPILTLFTVLSFGGVLFVAVAYGPVIDRYFLPVLPGVLAIMVAGDDRSDVAPRPQRRYLELAQRGAALVLRSASLASLIAVGLISAMLALNGFAFDAARWHTASKVVSSGVPADRVDGGVEWNGTHAPTGVMYSVTYPWASKVRGAFGGSPFIYPTPPCTIMSPSPLPSASLGQLTLLATVPYHTYLVSGSSALYVYATHVSGCPARMTAADA